MSVDVTAVSGFDIDGYNGTATAVFTVGSQTGLYTINLTTGAATARNVFTDNLSRRGLAFKQPGTPTVYAVTSDNMLLSFAPRSPSVAKAAPVAISGLAAGENVVDIDFRPATGQLYGLTSASKVYVINPTTGAASSAQTLSTALTGAIFGVDFNPISDRLRTVSDTKQNLSSNVADGLTTMDSPLTTTAGGGNVVAAAYTNNWAKPAVPASTKLFYLDIANDKLVTTADPSTGMLTDVGTLGVAAEGDAGFDIVGGHDGLALASLATAAAGPSSLYYVDLATGAATPVVTGASQIGGASGSLVRGIAVEIINPAQ